MAVSRFKVLAQGQRLRVKIVNAAGTAPTVYTTSAISPTHTMPKTITADTDFYFASAREGEVMTLTVTDPKGKVVYSGNHECSSTKPLIIGPELDSVQSITTRGGGNGLLPDGAIAEAFPRYLPVTNGSVLSDGRLSMVAVHLDAGTVVNSISFLSATTAANGPTHQIFGLFDSARVLLKQTADDTSTAWAANSVKTLSFTTAHTTTYSGLHYVGIMVTASSAVPTLHGYTGSTVSLTPAPIIAGTADSSLTTALPATATTITPAAVIPYCYLS